MPAQPLTPSQRSDAARLKDIFEQWKGDQKAHGRPASQEIAAEALGFGQSAFAQYVNGKIPLNVPAVVKMGKLFGCVAHDISPKIAEQINEFRDAIQEDASEFTLVERAEVDFSAGHGRVVFHEGQGSALSFRRTFLRDIGVSPKNAVIVGVSGESMSPTIRHGSVLLVSKAGAKPIVDREIYALRFEQELYVKRLRTVGGIIVAQSDNADKIEYPDFRIDEKTDDFEVIGRALWMGAKL